MNPFDLRGPEFLLFYFIFSAIVFLILFYLRQRDERRDAGKPSLDDPYLIACLRGGEDEALRVATLSLIDRGLLTFKSSGTSVLFPGAAENRLEVKDPIAIDSVKRPIEKSILEAFKTAKPVSSTLDSLTGSTDYACRLEGYGLLPGADIRSARRRRFMFALYVLLGVAGLKIVIALSRGRTNILFLILLAGLAAYVTSRTSNPFRTARGEEFLEDVKSLFSSLRLRAASLRPGGATSDLVWLASAYGLREVPPILFPQVTALYRRKAARGSGGWDFTDWSSGDSSCGTTTSCSSSGDSGSGGGSSCGGGGGCGGGGCGGCGS